MLEGVSHIMLAGRDLDRSFAFYTEGLGLRVVSRWAGGEYLAAGEDSITLILDPGARDGPLPEDTYLAFSVSPKSFDAARKRLRNTGALVWKDNPLPRGVPFTLATRMITNSRSTHRACWRGSKPTVASLRPGHVSTHERYRGSEGTLASL